VFKRTLKKPLGLVDVPNNESDLVLPLANGANMVGVSFGTPPTNSWQRNKPIFSESKKINAAHLHEFVSNAAHRRPQLHHLMND
jgi:hypothetical protein